MSPPTTMSIANARPYTYTFPSARTALIIIDMQRDFLDPGGFGSIQCDNPTIHSSLRAIVSHIRAVLSACRSLNFTIIHTREGHKPDLSDLPASKKLRQVSAPDGHHGMGIGDEGPMGRLLVRGEQGHGIVEELEAWPGEVVVDKPGKGSFWSTGLHRTLLARGITHLLFAGVTTECCVTTTLRECNDRGFECCLLSDCTGGFDERQVEVAMDTICGQDGLFGFVGPSSDFLTAVSSYPKINASSIPASDEILPSIPELQRLYKSGVTNPQQIINSIFDRIESYEKVDSAVWIARQPRKAVLAAVRALAEQYSGKPLPPLFGVPFALKDNIDIEGIVTTAACPSFAYTAQSTAPAVQLLLDAGAVYIGKLNMDQLATGLSGCRSPFGTPHSFYSKAHISGGSSSGSAIAIAASLVSFTLGTDTAGSGRVPAAYNGIVGFKPTKGTISARGVVPACASLDTLSIMAPTLSSARHVWYILDQHDALDPYAKPPSSLSLWHADFRGYSAAGFTFGIPPPSVLSACSPTYLSLFNTAVTKLQSYGGRLIDIDYHPFAAAGDLLYDATLVHERIACIGHTFLSTNLSTLHPTTENLFSSLLATPAQPWHVYRDLALRQTYTMRAQQIFERIDVLLTPTTPFHPTLAEMEADPIGCNAKVGLFSHSANVVDLCGVSVPAGFAEEAGVKLPFGVTFLGGSGFDGKVLDIAALFEDAIKQG